MSINASAFSLRSLLATDAATCLAMGVLLIAGAPVIAGLTDLPEPLVFYAGLVLLPIAAFMAIVAYPKATFAPGAWLIVAGNGAWVAASVLLLLSGWIAPNALGWAFVILQAVVVAGLAWLEHGALRQRHTAPLGAC